LIAGKTMENLRKRVNVHIAVSKKKALKLTASPSFINFRAISKDVVIVQKIKEELLLNRPLYVGFTILDLSKYYVANFHYDFVKREFGSKAELLFTDTDSLCYQVHEIDVYKVMREKKELFDTSNFPSNHPTYSLTNKKKLGKMKDEMGGKLISEFIGLRPKMYSLLLGDGDEKCTGKGISQSTLKRKIKHDDYKRCVFSGQSTLEDMYSIQSFNHQIHSVKRRKLALSAGDDKRYILKDGIRTLAHGHLMCGFIDVIPIDRLNR